MSETSSPLEPCIVDTNVLVYIIARHPLAATYRPHVQGRSAFIAFVTLGELRQMTIHERWRPERVQALEAFLRGFTVVHADDALCQTWGQVVGALSRAGRLPAYADSWLAVTALAFGFPLVTHNRRDFERFPGVRLISEAQH
jgi:predicted nucleic acid-binding protein